MHQAQGEGHLRIVVQHGSWVPHGLKQGDDVKEAVNLTYPVLAVGKKVHDTENTVSVSNLRFV